MNDSSSQTGTSQSTTITQLGAAEIARRIAAHDLSARGVVEAFLQRIEQVNPSLNAVVVPRFEEAHAAAEAADNAMRRGAPLGPLHGVPVTIKECFHVAGTPSTMGLTRRASQIQQEDAALVRRLREAGAIVLGKTNVPQLMIYQETDNPLYGRTNNPWDLERGPGGSSGGEAAIIAAGGSSLGLGSDLGGSIRQPCHVCGIHGIKPTSRRLPTAGMALSLRGMEAIIFQPGPMARRVEDLQLALHVLAAPGNERSDPQVALAPVPNFAQVRIEGMRIAMWTDDGFILASSAIRRAVEEAAEILTAHGAVVEPFQPPDVEQAMNLYYALLGADGGNDARRLLRGSKLDWRIGRLVLAAGLPHLLRPPILSLMRLAGQKRISQLASAVRPRTADAYWQLTDRRTQYVRRFFEAFDRGRFEAMIMPPHAVPAMPHGTAVYMLPASSYCYLLNLIGVPAGVVAATRVRREEEDTRPDARDLVDRLAKKIDSGSSGLPVGVQVGARYWREDVVLAIMAALEQGFRQRPAYPHRAMA